MFTIKQIELINHEKFAEAMLNENFKTFVVHVVTIEASLLKIIIHLLWKAQIAVLIWNKAPTKVSIKYSDFANVFLEKEALILLEETDFNKYTIEL